MLQRLRVRGFKSLFDVEVTLPQLAVLFGPNAGGKSNLIDAIQALSRLASSRTLDEALAAPIRGHPIEAFSFPPGGLVEQLAKPIATFSIEADLKTGKDLYRYRVAVQVEPRSGSLTIADEYLAALTTAGVPQGRPSIERLDDELRIRRKSKPAHPRVELIGLNHTILSDPRLGGMEYRAVERCRDELSGWRVYYLDPRVAMRQAKPPAAVKDIGVLGQDTAPFLYHLRAEEPKRFDAVVRTLRSLIPSVEGLIVDLDERRGTLDLLVRQDSAEFSSRIVSEGTLRVLALCASAVNPWGGGLLAFEEPENGVHPRRIELIAELLVSLAVNQGRQLVVTTHSPLFCNAMRNRAETYPEIGLFNVRQTDMGTVVIPFESQGPLFRDAEITKALTAETEDGLFESLMLRGLVDG